MKITVLYCRIIIIVSVGEAGLEPHHVAELEPHHVAELGPHHVAELEPHNVA
jgi:hypothetical protein